MKIVLVFIAVCFIALSCAAPVEDELEREKRSSSGESYRQGSYQPPFFSYNPFPNNNNMLNDLLTMLMAPMNLPAATGK